MQRVQNSKLKVERDESRNATVLTITLDDRDLSRHHLVPPDTAAPVDALAQYALHCLHVMHSQTVEEKYRLLLADRNNGYPEDYKPGRWG